MRDPDQRGEITRLLAAIEQGEPGAADELLERVYDELRRMAGARMARERPGQTIEPTALVNEVLLQLLGPEPPAWENRRHFFGAAAEAMRRYFIHRARRYAAAKRGGDRERVDLDEARAADDPWAIEILALDLALQELESIDERMAAVVKLRYFAGLTVPETAAALEISARTVDRLWQAGRAWLHGRMAAPAQ